ncbi:hypothetical protein GGF43_001228 [Coemansia sp. RSA 2618]|nr:hypothetical protein GGF43_001228 [Coemansia sp. RSA 2618]
MEYGLRQFFLPIETSVTWDEWAEGIEYTEPQPQPFAMPRRPLTPYSLQNTRIQAAVKIVSIEIPGGCTEYTERVWQVAGGDDERILATGIYFFDVENIANIEMQFRESVKHNIDCSGNKKEAMRLVYGDGQRNNTHGKYVYPNVHQSVNITNSKLVCFPNVYHYRISSVKRKDAAVSGHAKLLVFYFVDPSVRVLSTEMVPPQQQSWWAESVFATPPLRSLPYEIAEHILSYVTLPIPLKDACARRDIIEAKYTSAITQ